MHWGIWSATPVFILRDIIIIIIVIIIIILLALTTHLRVLAS
jgi:hypothetical protein